MTIMMKKSMRSCSKKKNSTSVGTFTFRFDCTVLEMEKSKSKEKQNLATVSPLLKHANEDDDGATRVHIRKERKKKEQN